MLIVIKRTCSAVMINLLQSECLQAYIGSRPANGTIGPRYALRSMCGLYLSNASEDRVSLYRNCAPSAQPILTAPTVQHRTRDLCLPMTLKPAACGAGNVRRCVRVCFRCGRSTMQRIATCLAVGRIATPCTHRLAARR